MSEPFLSLSSAERKEALAVAADCSGRPLHLSAYLKITGAERGLIALMTRGTVIAVSLSPQTVSV